MTDYFGRSPITIDPRLVDFRRVRLERGISQKVAAWEVGCGRQHLAHVESGRRRASVALMGRMVEWAGKEDAFNRRIEG